MKNKKTIKEKPSKNPVDIFLKPSIEATKRMFKNILSSYTNSWDPLAEPIQNGIDAIREGIEEGFISRGKLEIVIDSVKKTITIRENGIGIEKDNVLAILRPNETLKTFKNDLIGLKGVGLTFVIMITNFFRIKTNAYSEGVTTIISIKEANNWLKSSNINEKKLDIQVETEEDDFKGTEIIMENLNDEKLFELNTDQLEFILRSKTAIGNTKRLWRDDINVDISLKHIDINGEEHNREILFRYLSPLDCVQEENKVDIDDFNKFINEKDRTDLEKRLYLRDKLVFKKGTIIHKNDRKLNYLSCFLPKRSTFNKFSIENNLCTEEQLEDETWLNEFGFTVFTDGIYSAVKGMPTGIKLTSPKTGGSGYWHNMFILIEDDNLSFDIGRKSLHHKQADIHRKNSKKLFQEFYNLIVRYISGEGKTGPDPWEKDEIFSNIENDLLDLDLSTTEFLKSPSVQELSVMCMFFEAMGRGIIKDIKPLICGYKKKYDLYAYWGNRRIVIEFKSKLRKIFDDFNNLTKMFDQIDAIVCWDIDEKDHVKLKKLGLTIKKYQRTLNEKEDAFPNATHVLYLAHFNKPIYIIDIKVILNKN